MARRLRATSEFQGWDAAQKARLRRAAWRRSALRFALCAAALLAALSGCLTPRGPSATVLDPNIGHVEPSAAPAPAADAASAALSLAQARHCSEQRAANALAADLQARLSAAEASLQQGRAASQARVSAAETAATAAETRFSDMVRRLRAAEAAAAKAARALEREREASDRVRAAAEAEAATPEGALSAAALLLTVAALAATSCLAFRRSLVGAGERNRQVPDLAACAPACSGTLGWRRSCRACHGPSLSLTKQGPWHHTILVRSEEERTLVTDCRGEIV